LVADAWAWRTRRAAGIATHLPGCSRRDLTRHRCIGRSRNYGCPGLRSVSVCFPVPQGGSVPARRYTQALEAPTVLRKLTHRLDPHRPAEIHVILASRHLALRLVLLVVVIPRTRQGAGAAILLDEGCWEQEVLVGSGPNLSNLWMCHATFRRGFGVCLLTLTLLGRRVWKERSSRLWGRWWHARCWGDVVVMMLSGERSEIF